MITDRGAARSLAKIVSGIPVHTLASAAGRTTEAAKQWRKGRSCPSAASLINLAQHFQEVRDWVLANVDPADDGPEKS